MTQTTISSSDLRAEIIRLMREDFDSTPPNWEGRDWNDNAEDVADKIMAALAKTQHAPLSPRQSLLTPALRARRQGRARDCPPGQPRLVRVRLERRRDGTMPRPGPRAVPCERPGRAHELGALDDGQVRAHRPRDRCQGVSASAWMAPWRPSDRVFVSCVCFHGRGVSSPTSRPYALFRLTHYEV